MQNCKVDWTQGYHLTWYDHLNADWSCENIRLLSSRHGSDELFGKLLTHHEVLLTHQDHHNVAEPTTATCNSYPMVKLDKANKEGANKGRLGLNLTSSKQKEKVSLSLSADEASCRTSLLHKQAEIRKSERISQ